ncbi:MAG: DUF2905 domain-containing protein [Oxalobacteraceae bacterium]
MIRWVAAIFLLLTVFYPLLPFLDRLWLGRVPGDVRFRLRGVVFCLPFGSTVVCSLLAFAIARLARLY